MASPHWPFFPPVPQDAPSPSSGGPRLCVLRLAGTQDTSFATGCNRQGQVQGGRHDRDRKSASSAVATWARRMRSPCPRSALVFDTDLRPRLEVICASQRHVGRGLPQEAYGFARATSDWHDLVADPKVEAVVIASPQHTHRRHRRSGLLHAANPCSAKSRCPSLEGRRALTAAAEAAAVVHMIGFN